MISLDLFKKIIQDIEKQDETDRKLTKLLVSKHCTGFISTAEDVINDLTKLMSEILQDEYEYIEWYLYEAPKNHKFVYDNTSNENKQLRYNLNDIESLYYYILKDFDKVPKDIIDKKTDKKINDTDYDSKYIRKAI